MESAVKEKKQWSVIPPSPIIYPLKSSGIPGIKTIIS